MSIGMNSRGGLVVLGVAIGLLLSLLIMSSSYRLIPVANYEESLQASRNRERRETVAVAAVPGAINRPPSAAVPVQPAPQSSQTITVRTRSGTAEMPLVEVPGRNRNFQRAQPTPTPPNHKGGGLFTDEEKLAFQRSPVFPFDMLAQFHADGGKRTPDTDAYMLAAVQRSGPDCHGHEVQISQTRSQQFEDMTLFMGIYCGGSEACDRNKVIVEIGALDGNNLSNSVFFERHFGWRCLLIEAEPENARKLKAYRPNAITRHAAICSGTSVKFARSPAIGSGGVVDTLDQDKILRYKIDTQHTIEVPCTNFRALFTESNITEVEVFSLDVEGAEYTVLQEMDWSVPVRFWIVELDTVAAFADPSSKSFKVRTLLESHGYFPAPWGVIGPNIFFIRRREDAFPVPRCGQ